MCGPANTSICTYPTDPCGVRCRAPLDAAGHPSTPQTCWSPVPDKCAPGPDSLHPRCLVRTTSLGLSRQGQTKPVLNLLMRLSRCCLAAAAISGATGPLNTSAM